METEQEESQIVINSKISISEEATLDNLIATVKYNFILVEEEEIKKFRSQVEK